MKAADGDAQIVVVAAVGHVARFWREERQCVVAPVVRQPLLLEEAVLDEAVDRHQLERGHAEPLEVLDHAGMRQRRIGAALWNTHVVEELGEPLHVGLVDHRLGPGHVRRPVVAPRERVVDHNRFRHRRRAVAPVEGEVGARREHAVAEQSVRPARLAEQRLGVGIDQQLVGVEAMPLGRLVGAVSPVAVEQARLHVRQIAVPDLVGAFRHLVAGDLPPAAGIEDA